MRLQIDKDVKQALDALLDGEAGVGRELTDEDLVKRASALRERTLATPVPGVLELTRSEAEYLLEVMSVAASVYRDIDETESLALVEHAGAALRETLATT